MWTCITWQILFTSLLPISCHMEAVIFYTIECSCIAALSVCMASWLLRVGYLCQVSQPPTPKYLFALLWLIWSVFLPSTILSNGNGYMSWNWVLLHYYFEYLHGFMMDLIRIPLAKCNLLLNVYIALVVLSMVGPYRLNCTLVSFDSQFLYWRYLDHPIYNEWQ